MNLSTRWWLLSVNIIRSDCWFVSQWYIQWFTSEKKYFLHFVINFSLCTDFTVTIFGIWITNKRWRRKEKNPDLQTHKEKIIYEYHWKTENKQNRIIWFIWFFFWNCNFHLYFILSFFIFLLFSGLFLEFPLFFEITMYLLTCCCCRRCVWN